MEYNEHNKPIEDLATQVLLENITHRLNDQSCTIAELRSEVMALKDRMDDETHSSSEEFGRQVIDQISAALPTLIAAAKKAEKTRGGRR